MRTLVTGASGFIGTRLVQVLRARGDKVAVLVRKTWLQPTDVEMRQADLTQAMTLDGKCANVDTVFHLAG